MRTANFTIGSEGKGNKRDVQNSKGEWVKVSVEEYARMFKDNKIDSKGNKITGRKSNALERNDTSLSPKGGKGEG